ncbi:prophage endopeptidase tail family protein [Lactiplantibacillus paraxiangfangensis]|uniref:prophage endopeptidase tail family protein n=1 Tax=Lactiplantibacillus paraxiangfangensis TaxID=3076224 RepID=UPI0030C78053
MSKQLFIRSRDGQHEELLVSYDRTSKHFTWKRNQDFQIEFTAFNDESVAYQLLQSENLVLYRDQLYVIKNVQFSGYGVTAAVSVTAVHIYKEAKYIRDDPDPDNDNSTKKIKITPKGILKRRFDGNKLGFSYEVIGDFNARSIAFSGVMSGSAADALDLITSKWSAVIYPDNKTIRVYSLAEFKHQTNNDIIVGYDTSDLPGSSDSTDLTNVIMCYGKKNDLDKNADYKAFKDAEDKAETKREAAVRAKYKPLLAVKDLSDDEKADLRKKKSKELSDLRSDSKKTLSDKQKSMPLSARYAYSGWYRDEDSIKLYGEKIAEPYTNDDVTTEAEMLPYVKAQIKPNPTLAFSINYYGEDVKPGDIWTLKAPQSGINGQQVFVTAISDYDEDPSQPMQIDLDNSAKSILDYDVAMQKAINTSLSFVEASERSLITQIIDDTGTIDPGGDVDGSESN